MEIIFITIGFYIGIWLLVGFFNFLGYIRDKISEAFKKRRENIENEVANDLFKNLSIERKIEDARIKLTRIIGKKSTEQQYEIEPRYYSRADYQYQKIIRFMGKCPECNKNFLSVDYRRDGVYLACRNYQRCNYSIHISEAKAKFKETIEGIKKDTKNQFAEDFKQAYQ